MIRSGKKKVALGMSGGVDSSIAALLLREAGYEVIGLTMLIWDPGLKMDGRIKGNACYGPGEREDLEAARQVAARLGIPHHAIRLAEEYNRCVLDWFRERYLEGATPNPCAICNPTMKFGHLLDKAREQGVEFDYFATGHYVRRRPPEQPGGRYRLFKGLDPTKDQSYFLARLDQRQLAGSLFPLGDRAKTEIKELARQAGLAELAEKSESQDFFEGEDLGVLFPADKVRPGPIVDFDGRRIGTHRGIVYYTVGQREGLGVATGRKVYVKEIDAAANTIVLADRDRVNSRSCRIGDLKWISGQPPADHARLTAHLRYRHRGAFGTLSQTAEDTWKFEFEEPQFAVAPGQLAAIYQDDEVLGGGWILQP